MGAHSYRKLSTGNATNNANQTNRRRALALKYGELTPNVDAVKVDNFLVCKINKTGETKWINEQKK
jgi:hypothetical protein